MRSLERVLGVALLVVVTVSAAQQLSQFYTNGAASNSGGVLHLWDGFSLSLFGAAAAAGVLFEALLYPVGRYCIKAGNYGGAVICFLMLASALVYTGILDYEANMTGRLDRAAERNAVVDNRSDARAEIEQLNAERKAWLARIESPRVTRKEVSDLTAKLDANNDRIEKLRRTVAEMKASAGGAAPSQALSANLGYNEATLTLIIVLTKLVFPMLMRAFGLSITIYALEMASGTANNPKEAKEAPREPQSVAPPVVATEQKEPPTALIAQEKKPSQAIAALKAKALSLNSDPIEAAVEELCEAGAEEFSLDDIMDVLATICKARKLPLPDRRAVGKKLSKLGYDVDRPKTYTVKKGTQAAEKAAA